MISKAQIQFVRSLEHKKFRDETGCFVAEGDKLVREALTMPPESGFEIENVYGTESWIRGLSGPAMSGAPEIMPVTDIELQKASLMKTPNQALAVIRRKQQKLPVFDFNNDLLIGLDQVQDPGNTGTLVRLADWFGLGGVVASPDSADFFSPKVVQASMGSIFRVKLVTIDLIEFISGLPPGFPVYGTHLKGENLYEMELTNNGLILMGNESRGLNRELDRLATKKLLIPNYSTGDSRPESLNVSIAAAIVCSEFRRRGNG